jgi:hypothetical protein
MERAAMIEELFTDANRQLLMVLVTQAMVRIESDPAMQAAITECHDILSKLTGTDTVLIARRAYASRSLRLDPDQEALNRTYHNPAFPSRLCDACHEPYTGPALYCSLQCTLVDA